MTRTEDVLNQIDEAIDDWTVGPDAMRQGAPAQRLPQSSTISRPAMAQFAVRFRLAMEGFARGMAKVAKAVNTLVETNPALRRTLGLPVYDKHHPRPLCINGAAYHQRRRNRRKKR